MLEEGSCTTSNAAVKALEEDQGVPLGLGGVAPKGGLSGTAAVASRNWELLGVVGK